MTRINVGIGAASLLTAAACGGADGGTAVQVARDTIGDTVVVRTLAGREWAAPVRLEPEMRIGTFQGEDVYMLGEVTGFAVAPDGSVYLYDRQVPALRKYDAHGSFLATFGREGAGPGEYREGDGGLAVLPDGRVLLRDPGNARINVYSSEGEPLAHWPLRGGYFTSMPIFVDTAGRAYTHIWGERGDGERYSGLQRYGSAGEKLDSLIAPDWDFEPEYISATGESFSMRNSVPFSPGETWTFSPHAYFVGGVSDRYAIDLFRTDSTVLRIARAVESVPVEPDEKANAEARATANFRRMVPDWKWNGPPIPDHKPPFRSVLVGRRGRIWVQLSQPGQPIPEDRIGEVSPGDPPPERWREPIVWDVFEPDGTYLGQVRAPEGLSTRPQPIFDGDQVWAVVRDDLDVEYLMRFRAVHPTADSGG